MNNGRCFSPWVSWANRNTLAGKGRKDQGGVYLFGRFDHEPPPGPADPLQENVIYVGQSSKRTFKGRWDQFERAVKKVSGKGRARRYVQLYGTDLSDTHVSSLPVDELLRAFLRIASCSLLDITVDSANKASTSASELGDLLVKYMERRLILLHALHNGRRPSLNTD